MNDYLAAIVFFLPAGAANVAPLLANQLPGINRWNTPLDFGKSWRGQRVFGDNKTWRGLLSGALLAGITGLIIYADALGGISGLAAFGFSAFMGMGALLGDAVESFFKRRVGKQPGDSWFPFDQLDYIIGGLVCAYVFVPLPLWAIAIIFIVYFCLHVVVSYVGYLLGLKPKPI